MSDRPRPPIVVAPIVAELTRRDGVLGLHERAEAFDYACSRARGDAIDRILLDFLDSRGWALDDQHVLDDVTVEHDGDTRARILHRGVPVTPWWQDRIERGPTSITWTFEVESAEAAG